MSQTDWELLALSTLNTPSMAIINSLVIYMYAQLWNKIRRLSSVYRAETYAVFCSFINLSNANLIKFALLASS